MPYAYIRPEHVQYMGIPGISRPCLLAVDVIVNSEVPPSKASLVTYMPNPRSQQGEHLFLFWDWIWSPLTVVHSGFASGYGGVRSRGPRSLSMALSMIKDRGIPINNVSVSEVEFDSIENRRLNVNLIERLRIALDEPVSPHLIEDMHWEEVENQTFWSSVHDPRMNFDFIDPVISLESRSLYPDEASAAILKAFIVVEEQIRLLISQSEGENLTGERLITEAFRVGTGLLTDKSLPRSEQEGLLLLFKGAYQLVRNPRAHRVIKNADKQLDIELLYLADLLLRLLPGNSPSPIPDSIIFRAIRRSGQ